MLFVRYDLHGCQATMDHKSIKCVVLTRHLAQQGLQLCAYNKTLFQYLIDRSRGGGEGPIPKKRPAFIMQIQ